MYCCLQQAAPDVVEAETCFQQALTIARRQQARSWELRAAMSLSRLWQRQGREAAAYRVLAEVYGWFTEGFDTADLQEARALLAVLEDNAVTKPCGFRPARCPGVTPFVESDLQSVGLQQVPYYPYSVAPAALSRQA